MGLFSRKKTEKRSADGDGNASWLQLQGIYPGGYLGYQAQAITSVCACVNLISNTIGMLRPLIRDVDGKVVRNHMLSDLLMNPSRDLPWHSWVALLCQDFLLWGNALAVMENKDGRMQLTHVPWRNVTYYDGTNYYYQYPESPNDTIGTRMTTNMSDMLHWRATSGSRDAGYTGRSALERCSDAINLSGILETSVRSYFQNGCAPSGILSMKKPLTQEQRKSLNENFAEGFAGATKQGRPLLVDSESSWMSIGSHAQDSQLVEQRRFQISEISRIFLVPLSFLSSDLNTQTYASAYEQRTTLLLSLQSYISSFISTFSVKFLDNGEQLVLDEKNLVREPGLTRMQTHQIAINSGIYGPEYARQMEQIDGDFEAPERPQEQPAEEGMSTSMPMPMDEEQPDVP